MLFIVSRDSPKIKDVTTMILLTIKQQMFVNVCLKIFSFHYEVGDFSTVLTSE